MRAMILAAGRGERMRPLTDNLPKALVEVVGESLIERHLRMLAANGVETVVINLGWLGEKIIERLGGGDRFDLQIIYSPEYDNILETAGGIQRALPMLGDEPFWVINCDIYSDLTLADIDVDNATSGHLVLVSTPAYKAAGDFGLVDGRVRNLADPPHTFSGVARYAPEFFANVRPGRSPLAPQLRSAADEGRLSGSLHDGLWADVGTPQRLDDLELLLKHPS